MRLFFEPPAAQADLRPRLPFHLRIPQSASRHSRDMAAASIRSKP
jgi:hypothetical protein